MYRQKGKKAPQPKTIPDKFKHKLGPGRKSINVCAAFGDGRCLFAVLVGEDARWEATV